MDYVLTVISASTLNSLYHYRAGLEYEEAKADLTAQAQAMEKDLVAMAQEAEKLRADIAKRRASSRFFSPSSLAFTLLK
jgi:uncharacterized protein YqfA (UPF0365 family)